MTDLYEVLGVRADASEDAIRRAYRAAARREHPDVSAHPQAADRMALLNEAYGVLGDPAARAGYDRYRTLPEPERDEGPWVDDRADGDRYPWLRCERCGAETADLRFRVFVWVFSVVVRTWRRTTPGLFCRRCRRRLAWNRSLASLLLGPWGIPAGPFRTVGAIWRNARGGYANATVDANFEAHLRQAGRMDGETASRNGAPKRRRRRAWAFVVLLVLVALVATGVVVVAEWDGALDEVEALF